MCVFLHTKRMFLSILSKLKVVKLSKNIRRISLHEIKVKRILAIFLLLFVKSYIISYLNLVFSNSILANSIRC